MMNSANRYKPLVGLTVTLWILMGGAGLNYAKQDRPQPGKDGGASPDENHRIRPGDVIEVLIEKAPELSGTFRVNSRGTILMNYLGRVTASEKTPKELAKSIEEALAGRYLRNPQVTVIIREPNKPSYFIQGAVVNPGPYRFSSSATLLELINMAGGLTEDQGATIYIVREIARQKEPGGSDPTNDEKPKYRTLEIDVNKLRNNQPDQNVLLEPGDIVNIPPAGSPLRKRQ